MALKRISDLVAATTPLAGTELLELDVAGDGRKVTAQDIADLASATLADGDYGDITVSGSGTLFAIDAGAVGTTELADDAVTNAKAAHMATQTIKGRTTAGTGDPEDLTAAQAAAIVQGDGLLADSAGFRGIPQVSFSANTTIAATHGGKELYHPSSDANARTVTIDANATLALPVGFAFRVCNETANVVSIAITTDTLVLAGTGSTGTRSLAQYGSALFWKVGATRWFCQGAGLT